MMDYKIYNDFLLILMFCILFEYGKQEESNCTKICKTTSCVQLASIALSKINEDIDKCENFYEYSCGKYPENSFTIRDELKKRGNEISFLSSYWSMFNILKQSIENSEDPNSNLYKAKMVYESCVKFTDFRKELRLMKQRIIQIMPKWPDQEAVDEKEDIDDWIIKFFLAGEFSFFKFSTEQVTVSNDLNNPETVLTSVSPIQLKVKIERDTSDICSDDFSYFFRNIAQDLELPDEIVDEIIEDALKIDHFLNTEFQNENPTEVLDCENSRNRFCRLFQKLKNSFAGNFSKIEFILINPEKLNEVDNMLSNFSSKSIANYLAVRFLMRNIGVLSEFSPFIEYSCEINTKPAEVFQFQQLPFKCIQFLTRYVPFLLIPEYTKSRYIIKKYEQINFILKEVISSAESLISSSQLNEDTKKEITTILEGTFIPQIEYLDHINEIIMTEDFSSFTPHKNSFFLNIEAINKFLRKVSLENYRLGNGYKYFSYNPFTMKAIAGLTNMSSIGLDFAHYEYAHYEFKSLSMIHYMSFAFLLGHELAHNIQNYIVPEERQNITAAAIVLEDCINKIYSNFQIPMIDVALNVEDTFAENFADIFGLKFAYSIFVKGLKYKDIATRLPGLSRLTDYQLFFLLNAQNNCEFGDDYSGYKEDYHSPFNIRILGSFRNMEEFSDHFNCQTTSFMNLDQKCNIK